MKCILIIKGLFILEEFSWRETGKNYQWLCGYFSLKSRDMCGEGRRKGLWSTSAAIHNIKAFIFSYVVVDLTFYFTFSCCDGPADLCASYFFILVYCVPVLVRKGGWVEKASFPISSSWQAVCLRIDAPCWLSVGAGGTCDRDRWWHAGVSDENGSVPSEEECFPHQQSLLSPSLKVGNGGMVAWWSTFF